MQLNITMRIVNTILLLFLVNLIDSKERIWKYDSDIANTANWIGGKLGEECQGLHFAPINSAPIFIHDLTTYQLVLPIDGTIVLVENGRIILKNNHKCVKLKPLEYHHWYDPDSWVEPSPNPAIPDKERIPCDHDDIIVPNYHSRVIDKLGVPITVNSLKLNTEVLTQTEFKQILGTTIGSMIFFNPLGDFPINIEREPCKNPQGCLCHRHNDIPCPSNKPLTKVTCLNPIFPEQFCREICGAYITFKPNPSFLLEDFRVKLAQYSVHTYASRLTNYLGDEVVQVVFTEDKYSETSLIEAQDLFEKLQTGEWGGNLQLQKSGRYVGDSGGAHLALSIVFGTLIGVMAFFAIVFYTKEDSNIDFIISRFTRGTRSSVFSMPFFARFDNIDENLIIDGQSVAGSSSNLAKSFDNPMYGTPETPHANPLYYVTLKDED